MDLLYQFHVQCEGAVQIGEGVKLRFTVEQMRELERQLRNALEAADRIEPIAREGGDAPRYRKPVSVV